MAIFFDFALSVDATVVARGELVETEVVIVGVDCVFVNAVLFLGDALDVVSATRLELSLLTKPYPDGVTMAWVALDLLLF